MGEFGNPVYQLSPHGSPPSSDRTGSGTDPHRRGGGGAPSHPEYPLHALCKAGCPADRPAVITV